MTAGRYSFDRFSLDTADRTLCRDGVPVEISARYLDALVLLVSEAGSLVTKDRFHREVWRGVPVTDEALTQCIKTLRRRLGDDAARPRFIVTVPKYGYRFVAPLRSAGADSLGGASEKLAEHTATPRSLSREFFVLGAAGTLGAGIAGLAGGLLYGAILSAQQPDAGVGGTSVLMVLIWLTMVAAVVGGAGVSFGVAAATFARGRWWSIVGGAIGGFIVGGTVKLLGLDAFNLLLGHSPGNITGAPEGLLLGGAVGLGAWLSEGRGTTTTTLRQSVSLAAISGAAAGVTILILGGELMAGSLDLLSRNFPGSRIDLGQLGRVFGETGFGPVARLTTGGLEGALFSGCIVGAMCLARRTFDRRG